MIVYHFVNVYGCFWNGSFFFPNRQSQVLCGISHRTSILFVKSLKLHVFGTSILFLESLKLHVFGGTCFDYVFDSFCSILFESNLY